ncbi:MAG: DNA mismatch repair protein MutS [Clostridiales bacterium]|nr:DNA mismatch repair protein MutS [Clostridiales bacterium]
MALSPMMQQYFEIKEQYKDCILFFRLGDFYEMFFDDAILGSRELELTLTGRNCGQEERAPMCGVPYHSADTYIAKLVERGYKVAICEQIEDPSLAKGIVKRDVIKIITPGTVTNQSMLSEKENNYLAAVYYEKGRTALSYCDISTGEVLATVFTDSDTCEILLNELVKIDAKEVLVSSSNIEVINTDDIKKLTGAYINLLPEQYFNYNASEKLITGKLNSTDMNVSGITRNFYDEPELTCAIGALFTYLIETQKQDLSHLTSINVYKIGNHMSLDKATIRNLELTETLYDNKIQGSLLGVLDKTHTAMGGRKMKQWIREPLNTSREINDRLNAVEVLVSDIIIRNNIKEGLKRVYDIERLVGRIACNTANGKDLIALRNSVVSLPDIKEEISFSGTSLLSDIESRISELSDLYNLINDAVVEEPPFIIKEGGIIKEGYSDELDNLKASISDAQKWIAGLESSERERTGIKNLKVGFNKVFGYYIEVTKSYYDLIPDNYIRKQTLANAERFITPELKETESLVLNAETKINQLEYSLFVDLRDKIKSYIPELQETAKALAELDVLQSFAEVSDKLGYIKPEVDDDSEISIEKGRHPVIEQAVKDGVFVPNDLYVDCNNSSMLLITGPNMAGKSTYMRQVALIVLMAQIGCFVPCEAARIGVVDRIFTRIGASDNLSQGQSTFYVEMSELSYILSSATERSLIILDEIGRGTSTYDGLSIAWAAIRYLCCSERRIRTLFATHYHELTVLENELKGFKNLNVDVTEINGNIVFLHKIVPGSASKSYGIHVAKLAGVPKSVLNDAEVKLSELENVYGNDNTLAISSTVKHIDSSFVEEPEEQTQLSFFSFAEDEVVTKLKALNLMEITPSKAIAILEELQELARKN